MMGAMWRSYTSLAVSVGVMMESKENLYEFELASSALVSVVSASLVEAEVVIGADDEPPRFAMAGCCSVAVMLCVSFSSVQQLISGAATGLGVSLAAWACFPFFLPFDGVTGAATGAGAGAAGRTRTQTTMFWLLDPFSAILEELALLVLPVLATLAVPCLRGEADRFVGVDGSAELPMLSLDSLAGTGMAGRSRELLLLSLPAFRARMSTLVITDAAVLDGEIELLCRSRSGESL